jgi:hypothetical protein
MKVFFKHLARLNLGYESDLELVEVDNTKYIIKTYKGEQSETNRNKEILFHQKLDEFTFPSLKFYYQDKIASNQLCIEYIDDMKLWHSEEVLEKSTRLARFTIQLLIPTPNQIRILTYQTRTCQNHINFQA